tara:strand:+ start:1579 stop:2643 length:1065 start_codon:yes stop_codon:yes gene_type:complete
MQLINRIQAFAKLGKFMSQFSDNNYLKKENIPYNDLYFNKMVELIKQSKSHNGWFNESNIQFAFKSWGECLTEKNLQKWTTQYNIDNSSNKKIAIILAGNIPLVGFHDFLSVLISGNNVIAKLSSNDKLLLPFLANYLIELEPAFMDKINFTSEQLVNFDAVIATGSNNTARYFDYYFGKYPNIIRKNRNSVAILSGNETEHELTALADDIFRYYGLGCRNVSKIYIPEGYNFETFFKAIFCWKEIINDHKYINNYDYNKAVYLMSNINLLDNEFLLLKEDTNFSSPISVLFYEYYENLSDLKKTLEHEKENIQCIVSNMENNQKVNFGDSQSPNLWDYADDVDTLDFLLNLAN